MKRIIAITVSLGILGILYSQLDLESLHEVVQATDSILLILSLSIAAPIAALTGLRFSILTRASQHVGVWTGIRLVLASSVLNLVLPSKLGDIAKAAFLVNERLMSGSRALAIVTFEKLIDLVALLFWCVLGLMFLEEQGWIFWTTFAVVVGGLIFLILLLASSVISRTVFRMLARILPAKFEDKIKALDTAWAELTSLAQTAPGLFLKVGGFSIGLWAIHLGQIWLFSLALGTSLPLGPAFGLVPLAILIGLFPLTFAGIGSRDAALVILLAPYMSEAVAVLLGILCTMRYVLPALAGIPFFTSHLALARATPWRRGAAETTKEGARP